MLHQVNEHTNAIWQIWRERWKRWNISHKIMERWTYSIKHLLTAPGNKKFSFSLWIFVGGVWLTQITVTYSCGSIFLYYKALKSRVKWESWGVMSSFRVRTCWIIVAAGSSEESQCAVNNRQTEREQPLNTVEHILLSGWWRTESFIRWTQGHMYMYIKTVGP